MADLQRETTYSAAEAAALEDTIRSQQSQIQMQQAQIDELKRKLDHPMQSKLAEAVVQAYEAGAAAPFCDSCG